MFSRNSIVDDASIKVIVYSSNFQIGDSNQIMASSDVFAVQKTDEYFYPYEGDVNENAKKVIPLPVISEKMQFHSYHLISNIHVSSVNIIGMSTSAIFQIGTTGDVYLESRTHLATIR